MSSCRQRWKVLPGSKASKIKLPELIQALDGLEFVDVQDTRSTDPAITAADFVVRDLQGVGGNSPEALHPSVGNV